VLLAGAVMGAVLYPLRDRVGSVAVIGQIAVGAGVYGLVLLLTNFLGLGGAVWRKLRPHGSLPVTGPDESAVPTTGLAEAQ